MRKSRKQLLAENIELQHRIDEVLNEMQYANAWKQLCYRLELPYASHVNTVLSAKRPNTRLESDAADGAAQPC